MVETVAEIIAKLEQKNAQMQTRLDELERTQKPKPAPKRIEDERPLQTFDLSESFVMPSAHDLEELFALTCARFPQFARDIEGDLFGRFVSAFRFTENCRRITIDDDHRQAFSLGWWLDAAHEWLTARSISPSRLHGDDFALAIIAANDVDFILPSATIGQLFEHGLHLYRGKPATDAWRQTLVGTLRTPRPARSPTWLQNQVQTVW